MVDEPPCRTRVRALLVDDVDNIRAMIDTYLTHTGIAEVVGQADNGEEAVALAFQLRPDVVIMDINMPVMDGVQATREIKRMPNPPRIIIVSTGDEWAEQRAKKAGADAFCLKQNVLSGLAQHIAAFFPPA
jgi:CheY-like chemotaxis protein